MKRNTGLDFLKFICCFLVICIHTPFPETTGKIVTTIARIAVPVFFMITGYFYSYTKKKGGETRQIIKIAKLFIGSNALYLLYGIFIKIIKGKEIIQILRGYFYPKSLIAFIFLNESPFSGHLWYLGAILYVLIIVYCFEKKCNIEKLYYIIPILLLMDLVFGKYSLLILGKSFPYILVRNFLCVGLPYFLIGDMISKIKPKIKSSSLYLLVFAFIFITLSESFLLRTFNLGAPRDHYISTTFLSIFVFLFWVNYNNMTDNKLYQKCCFIGSKLTLYIYIIHPIIISKLSVIENGYSVNIILNYTRPFFVFLVSILISWIFYVCSRRIQMLIHNKKTVN